MLTRPFGRTGRQVGEVGFGAWAIGGSWGEVDASQAKAALTAALDAGVTFIDTADVYGDGRSERLIAEVLDQRGGERPFVATKAGRRLPKQVSSGYTLENLSGWIDRSLHNLRVDTLDLVQLHCPPGDLYDRPEVFGSLDRLVEQGKVRDYGVSVETVDEALRALNQPRVVSIQIVFNIFRQKPIDRLFAAAQQRGVAIIARVPLASGLLTGKLRPDSTFDETDHRRFNRHGEAFDVGETFAGVDYEAGLKAVEAVRPLVGGDTSMAAFALRWILMFEAVSVVIPGAKSAAQALANSSAAALPALSQDTMGQVRAIYDEMIRPLVHDRW